MKSFTLTTGSVEGFLNLEEEVVVFENERFILNITDSKGALFDKEEGTVFVSNQWFGSILEFPNAEVCVSQWEACLTLRSFETKVLITDIVDNKASGRLVVERFVVVREDGEYSDQFLEWHLTNFTVLFKERSSVVDVVRVLSGTFDDKGKKAIESRIARYLWD